MATTAVQAATIYLYSFMVMIAFECLHVLQVVGIHHPIGGKLLPELCAHNYASVHGAIFSSYVQESDISLHPRT